MNSKELEMKAREHDMFDFSAEVVTKGAEAAAEKVTNGYKRIEQGVVTGYKKIEDSAVAGFGKVVDKCVEVLFAREGESVENAKRRLSGMDRK